jgi:carbon-monoxide dehydrogenase small subunit
MKKSASKSEPYDKRDLKMTNSSSIFAQNSICLNVNNERFKLNVRPNWTLAFVLREKMGFTGVKLACDNGACGSCTVLMEGEAILSCMKLAIECHQKNIKTIEGLSKGTKIHPIQEAWLEEHGTQCGFCAPGMILTTKALLDKNPNPTERQVREALAGNICRCGNYDQIIQAVLSSSKKIREK